VKTCYFSARGTAALGPRGAGTIYNLLAAASMNVNQLIQAGQFSSAVASACNVDPLLFSFSRRANASFVFRL
jgi:hypothetical protein